MKWFKMDCDAQENLDMRKLIDEWGWDWYGRYWAILGMIGMLVNERSQTFALQTNDGSPFPVKLLANDCQTNVERMTNFLDYLANNHLIDKTAWKSKNLIYAPKLKLRADEYTKKLLTKSRHSPDQEEEVEEEVDKKKKKKEQKIFIVPPVQDVIDFFTGHGFPESVAVKAFEYYNQADWHDANGKKVRNWKQKMISVWFKEENRNGTNRSNPGQSQYRKSGAGGETTEADLRSSFKIGLKLLEEERRRNGETG